MGLVTLLHALPFDVGIRELLSWLSKYDQYKCCSTCKKLLPWLMECRTILLSSTTQQVESHKYLQQTNLWLSFVNSLECREKILKISNCLGTGQKRKLKLRINLEEFEKNLGLLQRHAEYFESVDIVGHPSLRSLVTLIFPLTIANPSSSSLLKFFRSYNECRGVPYNYHKPIILTRNFHEVIDFFRILYLDDYIDALKFGMRYNPNGKMLYQNVIIHGSSPIILDLRPLKGIPFVKIVSNSTLTNLSPLVNNYSVHLNRCSGIKDVSDLSCVTEVVLENMTLHDISMLNNVKRLRIKRCKVDIFPTPNRKGINQTWEFCDMITDHKNFSFAQFQHLYSLTLDHCNFPNKILHICRISKLRCVGCKFAEIHCISSIDELTFDKCTWEYLGIGESVGSLNVILCNTNGVTFMGSIDLRRLQISYLPIRYLALVDLKPNRLYSLVVEHCEHLSSLVLSEEAASCLNDLRIVICPMLKEVEIYRENQLEIIEMQTNRFVFDNISLRTAIAIWFHDQANAMSIYGDISSWNVSNVTDMSFLFCNRVTFNGNIALWDVSNVTSMAYMFAGAVAFYQPLDKWNIKNVTDFKFMFHGALQCNPSLITWNLSYHIYHSMFYGSQLYASKSLKEEKMTHK